MVHLGCSGQQISTVNACHCNVYLCLASWPVSSPIPPRWLLGAVPWAAIVDWY
jgi:hypothetical protein